MGLISGAAIPPSGWLQRSTAVKVVGSFAVGAMINVAQKAWWEMDPAVAELPLTLFQAGADLFNPPPSVCSTYKARIKSFSWYVFVSDFLLSELNTFISVLCYASTNSGVLCVLMHHLNPLIKESSSVLLSSAAALLPSAFSAC